MDTLVSLSRKLAGAEGLKSVVRTMKTMAASNIVQYEMAVNSLGDYQRAVNLGIVAYFLQQKNTLAKEYQSPERTDKKSICAIVFGSDQGLVGAFNDNLADFVSKILKDFPGEKEIWAVGERIQLRLIDGGLKTTRLFRVPNSVVAITPLVREILLESQKNKEMDVSREYQIFHNQAKTIIGYQPVIQKLLPLDTKWKHLLGELDWPSKNIPEVMGEKEPTLKALIREFLFVSLFKACAESLASENASRLAAMQRAEKNIEEILVDLGQKFHQMRQSNIDEELFDLISGFEALKKNNGKSQNETFHNSSL